MLGSHYNFSNPTDPHDKAEVNDYYDIKLAKATIGFHLFEVFLAPTTILLLVAMTIFIAYVHFKTKEPTKSDEDCSSEDRVSRGLINFMMQIFRWKITRPFYNAVLMRFHARK